MKSIHQYNFHKTKYGEELLIDIVALHSIKKYIENHLAHTLSYHDITFITSGTGCFFINDKQYFLNPDDVIFSKPNEIRAWDKNRIPQGYALIFEEEFLLSFFNDPLFLQNLRYFSKLRTSAKINISHINIRITDLLQNIIIEINNQQSKDKHILRALLYETLMLLNREYIRLYQANDEKPQNRYANNFIVLVDKHFHIHHNTKYYADELCITPNYLNQIVQKSLGITAKSYIQNKIIQEAKNLLVYASLSVSEISDKLNFENPSYFIRLFRKYVKLTPLQYRNTTKR